MSPGNNKSISFNSLCEKLEALNDKYCIEYTIEDIDNLPSIKFLRISRKTGQSANLELNIKVNGKSISFMLTPEILDMSTEDFLDYIEKELVSYNKILENNCTCLYII